MADEALFRGFLTGLAVIASLFSGTAGSTPEANGRGAVTGAVIDAEDGTSKPAARITVQLDVFREGMLSASARVGTDAKGGYRFPDLSTDSDFDYSVKADRGGVTFTTFRRGFEGRSELELEDIVLTPTTGDPSGVSAQDTVLVEFDRDNLLRITRLLTLENLGDKTYHPARPDARHIEMTLPEDGFDLTLLRGLSSSDVEVDDTGRNMIFRIPLKPGAMGRRTVEFSYFLRHRKRYVDMDVTASFTRESLAVLVRGRDLRISGAGLSPAAHRVIGGSTYFAHTSPPLEPKGAVIVRLEGLPLRSDVARRGLFAGLAAVLIAGLILLIRRPSTSQTCLRDEEECAMDELALLTRRPRSMWTQADIERDGSLRSLLFHRRSRREGETS